jgi:hypothetical protein
MAVPYLLFVEGISGAGVVDPNATVLSGPAGVGTARDLIALPTGTQQNVPRVNLETFSMTTSGSGGSGTVAFTIFQPDVTSTFTVTNVTASAGVVTYTAANTLSAGSVVSITGVTPTAYNLTNAVVATASSTQFTVSNSATGAYTSGGTVSIVPFYMTMADNAPIRFYDTRYNATQPVALAYVTQVQATMRALGVEVQITGADPINWLDKILVRKGKIGSSSQQPVGTIQLSSTAKASDKATLNEILYYVDRQSSAATRKILDTSAISGSGKTATRSIYASGYSGVDIKKQVDKIPVGTVRSALDTISEAAGGVDTITRKYWVDANGRINYVQRTAPKLAGTATANAPFEIVTVASQANPTGSNGTTTSKILATDIRVQYDHEQTIKRVFTRCGDFDSSLDATAPDPYVRTYNAASPSPALSTRLGPVPEALVDLPQVKGLSNATRDDNITKFSTSLLQIRSQPLRSVRLTILGANLTQVSNPAHDFGYTQGYYQSGTGPVTYALSKAFLPDQWIKVTAPALGINDILRIEAVTWSFAKGTTEATLEIECDWRRKSFVERIG